MRKSLLFLFCIGLMLNLQAQKKVAYVTLNKTTMVSTATTVQNDPIIQVLKADSKLAVTVKVIASSDAITDLADYDVIIVQESLGGGDAVLKPTGSLALKSIPKPFIYNKVYALKQTRAITTGTTVGGKESNGALSITVQPTALTNDIFKACTFSGTGNDQITLFNALTTDLGLMGDATSIKAVNYSSGNTISGSSTILAVPSILSTDNAAVAICINDIPAGSSIDSEVTTARMISMGMNFGAISADGGKNITENALTIWRNAVYILAGLAVPNTKAVLPTGVRNIENNGKVISENYYTTSGVLTKYPAKGVYIKKSTYENGATETTKVVLTEALVK